MPKRKIPPKKGNSPIGSDSINVNPFRLKGPCMSVYVPEWQKMEISTPTINDQHNKKINPEMTVLKKTFGFFFIRVFL